MTKIEAYSSVTVTDVSGSLIKAVDVMYYLSESNTSLIGGSWDTDPPAWENGKYYWQKTITTYYDDTTSETEPVCISGEKGDTGETGQGIVSITEEYYLSTSKTEQIGGEWSTTPPTWESGKYIWTRSVIVWRNPTNTTYTTPVCDSSWEAANDVRDELEEKITIINTTISGVSSRVDAVEKDIELKVWQTDITTAVNELDETISTELSDLESKLEIDIDGVRTSVSEVTSLVEKVDTKVDNLQQTGLGWKVNYSDFTTQANGQIYLHGYDSDTREASDVNGWVTWNGLQMTVPKATINPGSVCPSDTPIYVVRSAMTVENHVQGTFLVWTDEDGVWQYAILTPTVIAGEWEWNHSSDIILGSFYHAGNGQAIESAQIYSTALSCDSVITSIETKTIIDQTKEAILLEASETYATTNELEETNSNVASVKITADEVAEEVKNARGDSASLKVRINGIESSVTDVENNLTSTINQTASEIRSEVENADKNLQTQITENAEAIELKASTEEMNAAIKVAADEINSTVSQKQDAVKIRYTRDWVYGNDFDDSSSWVSCQIYADSVNIAEGITPTVVWTEANAVDEDGNEIDEIEPTIDNLGLYTDGKLISYTGESSELDEGIVADSSSYITDVFTGEACLQIDLGEVRTDIDYITVWHDYSEAKSYNHRFEISEDGENWTELFNSDTGTYIETSDGKSYYFADDLAAKQMSSIIQDIDSVTIKVTNHDSAIGELRVTANEISETVTNNKEEYDKFIEEEYSALEETVSGHAQQIIKLDGIETTVVGEIEKTSENITQAYTSRIEQTDQLWKLNFNRVGVTAISEEEYSKIVEEIIAITMDHHGIEVSKITTDDNGEQKVGEEKTCMDSTGFSGWYANEVTFELNKDYAITDRLLCKKGIDTYQIKMVPLNYTATDNNVYGMLAFVKSGGTS